MFERGISKSDVRAVLATGERLAEYPEDAPFPSYLMLGFVNGVAHHVVLAVDAATKTCHIVTAYLPDADLWEPDFRKRRSS
jgi:hypothetical protein